MAQAGTANDPIPAGGIVHLDLLPGWTQSNGVRMAGLRIRIADGWKTYWRQPGEVGVAPQFDWAGSQNLAAVKIFWPRPAIFEFAGQTSLGYQDEVVLPLQLTPLDPSKPIRVEGHAELGVCHDICVSVTSAYQDRGGPADAADIRAALARQPEDNEMRGLTCRIEPIGDGLRVTAQMTLPPQGGQEVTVVELPRNDVWIAGSSTRRDGNRLTAVTELVPPEAKPFALDRSTLRITVLGSRGAAESLGCPAAG